MKTTAIVLFITTGLIAGIALDHFALQKSKRPKAETLTEKTSSQFKTEIANCNPSATFDMSDIKNTLSETLRETLREEAVAIMLEASINQPANTQLTTNHREPTPATTYHTDLTDAQKEQKQFATKQLEQLIEKSINNANWNEKDNDQIRQLLGSVDRETEKQLMTQLASAINSGTITIDFDGPLF